MSFFWIFIYILIVVFILAMFFWSQIILQQQKKAWRDFAKKHDLVFKKAGFFEAGAVEGNYKKNRIGIFSEGIVDENSRGMVKYRTVIEIIFGYGMPGTGAIGNMAAMRIIEGLNFGPTHHPEHADWNKSHLVTASDRDFLMAYLTPNRITKLNSFLNMPNAVALLVYDNQDVFLRVETSDPMKDLKKIEKFTDKLVILADELKLTRAEEDKWVPSKI